MNENKKEETALEKLELETVCEWCDGRGHSHAGRWDRCIPCGGAGYTPTELGRRILALVAHHAKGVLDAEE